MKVKKFIELNRDDLTKFNKLLPIDKVTFYDFKSSVIAREEINRAEIIIFKDDDNKIKELKNRYRV